MPLYLNQSTVTVVRQGKRMKVQPSKPISPKAYDFTPEEVAAAEAAGTVMLPYVRPAAIAAPEVTSDKGDAPTKAETKAETAAEKKARERAEAAAAKAVPDDDAL